MEFFYFIKATQKSGKEDAVIWFTSKTEARANLQLDVELEDAGIETGRGKDYAKPVRTDFPVYNDLPEESAVDYTWCKRYELQDDGRTWLPKAGAESTEAVDNTAAPETTTTVETTIEIVPLENRTPAVRFAFHLTSDNYQTHISKEQQLAASEMSLNEGNTYLQNLLLAKNDIPEVSELSLNAEWKLVQAIKQVFAPDEAHETEIISAFMADWAKADAGDRNQLVEEWRSGKLTLLKSEKTSDAGVETGHHLATDDGIQIGEHDDENTRYPVCRMPFRKQLLAQFTTDELRHHVTREEYEAISALEMDTDNSYVQNLLLAAENCEEVKGYDTKDLWRYTDAIRKVFSLEKRHELALVLRFTRILAETDYIDRGLLVKEWVKGNRVSTINRTPSGANAGGGIKSDRLTPLTETGRRYEIAQGLLARKKEFDIYNPSLEIDVEANAIMNLSHSDRELVDEFVATCKIFEDMPGGMDYSRACNVATVKTTPENYWRDPVKHLEHLNRVMTETDHAHPDELIVDIACGRSSLPMPMADVAQPSTDDVDRQLAVGGGEFVPGVSDPTDPQWDSAHRRQTATHEENLQRIREEGALHRANAVTKIAAEEIPEAETTSNVQMEETGNDETTNGTPLSEGQEEIVTGESSTETDSNANALNNDSGHHNNDSANMLYTHLMVDIESMGKKPGAPIVSIGAVFFDPASGQTGPEFYKVISLESAMEWGGVPDASTILFWLKATPEARSEIIMDHAIPLDDALLQFKDFIAENAANGKDTVQVWGNGATFDNVLLEDSYARTGISCPWKYWNNRDVRTIVELGKAVGYTPRHEIPFEGEPHKAISDARHQVKYVSAIWQHLTEH
ncbi:3'-5' exoribonuclease [Enterobacter asburiae]|uniref:exonuclease n=1 Tax=Enterobacter asburiae TaxID=61645 RepID=UPI002B2528A3|nr:3'-5' exoribonuclease [Enterobacter asburiae]MEB2411011.1 3'-5' exoribonuclease [Enterobacter asburiae]